MTVTTTLARWSKQSNRRRVGETFLRAAPWLAAATILTWFAIERSGTWAGVATGGVAGVAIAIGFVRATRRVWHRAPSMAAKVDREQGTADLLLTALAIERGDGANEPLAPVVLARAAERVPALEAKAVAPFRVRTSASGGLTAVAATLLLLLTNMAANPDAAVPAATPPTHVLGEREKAQAKAIEDAVDSLAKDKTLAPAVRDQIAKAKQALRRAAHAQTGTAALAALSEASHALDEAAKELAKTRTGDAAAMAKMTSSQLAKELAEMAKHGDGARMAALAREAMRRAQMNPADAAALAQAMKDAIAQAKAGGDPWAQNNQSAQMQRLDRLGAAADQLAKSDLAAAKAQLGDLSRSMSSATRDARLAQLDAARRAAAQMHAMQRAAMNGQSMADARADAMRSGAPRPGAPRPGSGSGAPMPGQGMMPGQQGMMPGQGAGSPRPGAGGTPQPGDMPPDGALSVLQGPNMPGMPGGAQGTSGGQGGKTPSGAVEPETVSAEEVDTGPPISPDGVVRAIREHAEGEHGSEQFGPVRDHYAAIAEAAIHRDQIPLTRREFIQRYFEALRNREAP